MHAHMGVCRYAKKIISMMKLYKLTSPRYLQAEGGKDE